MPYFGVKRHLKPCIYKTWVILEFYDIQIGF